jgi:hypothetical protein
MILKKTLLALSFSFCILANAALPEYEAPVLLARANIKDSFNIPVMSFLNNTSPVINNRGDVSFKVMAVDGTSNQALWFKHYTEENGKILYTAPEERYVTDPSMNNLGVVVFNLYADGITEGLFTLDGNNLEVNQVYEPEDEELAYYTYPQILSDGKIYFRGTNQDNERGFYLFNEQLTSMIKEDVEAYGRKSSYLFRPALNERGEMSFKRRIGEAGEWDESKADEILLLSPKGSKYDSKVIARDRDLDVQSPFIGFLNSTSTSNSGMVGFTAVLEDSSKAIILYKEGQLKNVAIEKSEQISEIEHFAPKVNDQGLILFRAKDQKGIRGLYLAGPEGIQRLIGEGDSVMTDLGMGKILSNPNYPGFGGEVDMNDQGEIVFYSLVVGEKDNREWGAAVFKMSPKK